MLDNTAHDEPRTITVEVHPGERPSQALGRMMQAYLKVPKATLTCQYAPCGKEFEGNPRRARFCTPQHQVYQYRMDHPRRRADREDDRGEGAL